MQKNTGKRFPIDGEESPVWGNEFSFPYDLDTDRGAYEAARAMARRLVMVTQQDAKIVDAAIVSISRRYRFGTFIEQLWKGKSAQITVPRFRRLKKALAEATRNQRAQLDHDEMFNRFLDREGF